eukprot:102716-Prymnesium_polylepis.1
MKQSVWAVCLAKPRGFGQVVAVGPPALCLRSKRRSRHGSDMSLTYSLQADQCSVAVHDPSLLGGHYSGWEDRRRRFERSFAASDEHWNTSQYSVEAWLHRALTHGHPWRVDLRSSRPNLIVSMAAFSRWCQRGLYAHPAKLAET